MAAEEYYQAKSHKEFVIAARKLAKEFARPLVPE
jgi:hypothetical protein